MTLLQWFIGFTLSATALLSLWGAAETARQIHTSVFWVLVWNLILPSIAWGQRSILGPLQRQRILLLIPAVALGLRLLAIETLPNSQVSDFEAYHELAISLKSNGSYSLTGPAGRDDADRYLGGGLDLPRPTAFRAPGAPLWGALLDGSERAFKFANAIVGAATCIFIFLLVEPIGVGPATFAAMIWAVYPSAIFATLLYGTEVLYTFFVVLAAWLLSRKRSALLAWAFPLGLCLAWCALVRPPAIAVWLPACAATVGAYGKNSLRRLALVTIVFLMSLAPWTFRNWQTFHRFIPISTSQAIAFGRHMKTFARTTRHMTAAAGDEAGLAAEGWQAGIQALRDEVGAGGSRILSGVIDNLRHSFGTDSDLILWSSLQRYDPLLHPQPEENRVISRAWLDRWLLINQSFYTGILLFAVAALLLRPAKGIFIHDGIRFLGWHFLVLWAVLCLVPGVNRYHFSLVVPVVVIASAWGVKHPA